MSPTGIQISSTHHGQSQTIKITFPIEFLFTQLNFVTKTVAGIKPQYVLVIVDLPIQY